MCFSAVNPIVQGDWFHRPLAFRQDRLYISSPNRRHVFANANVANKTEEANALKDFDLSCEIREIGKHSTEIYTLFWPGPMSLWYNLTPLAKINFL